MISTVVKRIESTYGGDGVSFIGESSKGQLVSVSVPQELLEELSRYHSFAGHIGHAVWHMENKSAPFPCSSCDNR